MIGTILITMIFIYLFWLTYKDKFTEEEKKAIEKIRKKNIWDASYQSSGIEASKGTSYYEHMKYG